MYVRCGRVLKLGLFLYKPMSVLGFYSNHVSLCMSTLNQAYVQTVYLENQACIQNRLLYEAGFNTRHYGTLLNHPILTNAKLFPDFLASHEVYFEHTTDQPASSFSAVQCLIQTTYSDGSDKRTRCQSQKCVNEVQCWPVTLCPREYEIG